MKAQGRGNRRGFTLIEMLVVAGVIVLLAAIVGITAQGWIVHGRQLGTKAQIDGLALALSAYKTDLGSYPPRDRMIEALVEGLGGNIRWNGPYPLDQSKVGTISPSTGLLENARNGHLKFYDGTDVEPIYFDGGQKVQLDQFGRPIIYVPNRDYSDGLGTLIRNETGFHNPTTFQLISFGADGKSDPDNPGYLSYTDDRDNDGDGLVDRADNPKANSRLGREDVEDDLANW